MIKKLQAEIDDLMAKSDALKAEVRRAWSELTDALTSKPVSDVKEHAGNYNAASNQYAENQRRLDELRVQLTAQILGQ